MNRNTHRNALRAVPAAAWYGKTDMHFLPISYVKFIGYQVHFQELQRGLFLFDHLPCQTTMALKVKDFHDLSHEPEFSERKTNTEECPKYCLHENEFSPCPAKCECSYVRDLIQILRNVKTSLTPLWQTSQIHSEKLIRRENLMESITIIQNSILFKGPPKSNNLLTIWHHPQHCIK